MHLVLVNPYIVSSPPSKIEVGSVGDAVTLNCSARGSPLPRVTWFKRGKRVVSTEEDDGSDLLKSGVVIPSFQHSDAGVYTCLFYNDKNMTTEATTSLSKYECFVSKTDSIGFSEFDVVFDRMWIVGMAHKIG